MQLFIRDFSHDRQLISGTKVTQIGIKYVILARYSRFDYEHQTNLRPAGRNRLRGQRAGAARRLGGRLQDALRQSRIHGQFVQRVADDLSGRPVDGRKLQLAGPQYAAFRCADAEGLRRQPRLLLGGAASGVVRLPRRTARGRRGYLLARQTARRLFARLLQRLAARLRPHDPGHGGALPQPEGAARRTGAQLGRDVFGIFAREVPHLRSDP